MKQLNALIDLWLFILISDYDTPHILLFVMYTEKLLILVLPKFSSLPQPPPKCTLKGGVRPHVFCLVTLTR